MAEVLESRLKSAIASVPLDTVSVRQNIIHLAHNRVRALQGGRIRKLELDERVSLVLFWNKALVETLAHRHRQNRNSHEQEQRNSPAANEKVAPVHIASGHFSEPAVEPGEKLANRTLRFLLRTKQHGRERR